MSIIHNMCLIPNIHFYCLLCFASHDPLVECFCKDYFGKVEEESCLFLLPCTLNITSSIEYYIGTWWSCIYLRQGLDRVTTSQRDMHLFTDFSVAPFICTITIMSPTLIVVQFSGTTVSISSQVWTEFDFSNGKSRLFMLYHCHYSGDMSWSGSASVSVTMCQSYKHIYTFWTIRPFTLVEVGPEIKLFCCSDIILESSCAFQSIAKRREILTIILKKERHFHFTKWLLSKQTIRK